MEEKYSFLEKKIALQKYIQNQNKKNHTIKQIKDLKTKTSSTICLYCDNLLVNTDISITLDCNGNNFNNFLFCSNICKTIFYSNLHKIIPFNNKQIRFIPFELLNEESKEKYKNFVKQNHIYDKFNVRYSFFIKNNKTYIKSIFKFILKFEIIKTIENDYELNYIYFPTTDIINYNSIENANDDIKKKIKNKKCLFCKNETDKNIIRINKDFITGFICSIFCFKSFMTLNETHINHPFKYFFLLPNLQLLDNPDLILKYKNNINIQNTMFETEYCINTEKEILFTINMISY